MVPAAAAGQSVIAREVTPVFHYHVAGDEPGPWPAILSSAGLVEGAGDAAGVFVVRWGLSSEAEGWRQRVEKGAFLILEGDSGLAAAFGFRPTKRQVAVRNVLDHRSPKLQIVWEHPLELPVYEIPPGARVFAEERWEGAPLVAGFRKGAGAILWVAVTPGAQGYERFPYLLQALGDLGLDPAFRSRSLWAFLDLSYRGRVDLAYFARRWRKAGLSALHVAAWHYFEADAQRDSRLRELIEECHRQAIQVYAWLELPHVSEKFWAEHPEWREKTAILQDAHLDWRKLMNLANPDCSAAVARGVHRLINRFDWDGVNLAELYFESLEGYRNPARFTPMNDDIRAEFRKLHGFDPIELFAKNPAGVPPDGLRQFLDYRAGLARRLQEQWIREIEKFRRDKPDLALVLTHVDDRVDTGMRDLIGADAAALLPLLKRHDFIFLIEDPATIWDRGPQRYPEIAANYRSLTPRNGKLAIDINIVERYQDVCPTRQQTGTELFRQVHLASLVFPRVTLYAEHSLLKTDLPLLSAAATAVTRAERAGNKLIIASRHGVGIPWRGPAMVDGRLWPVADGTTLWLPAGAHAVEPATRQPSLELLDFNGKLTDVLSRRDGVEFAYSSSSRAFAVLGRRPSHLEIDGVKAEPRGLDSPVGYTLFLPRGQHIVDVFIEKPPGDTATSASLLRP